MKVWAIWSHVFQRIPLKKTEYSDARGERSPEKPLLTTERKIRQGIREGRVVMRNTPDIRMPEKMSRFKEIYDRTRQDKP